MDKPRKTVADPNEVKVASVDEILARCADPKRPSPPAVAEALLSLQRQVLLLNNNQRILQGQNSKLAAAIDRATDALFDRTDGAGGVTSGAMSALEALYRRIGGMEKATSSYVLFSAASVDFLRYRLPRLIKDNGGVFPSEKQCADELDAIMQEMKRKGDEAQANRARLEKAIEKMTACRFCKSWCKPGLFVPGGPETKQCVQEFIQVACPRCMQVSPQPLPPMNVPEDAKCGACGGALQREVTDENGDVTTMCQLFDFDVEAGRQYLLGEGIPRDEVYAAFPEQISPIEKNVGGSHEPSIGSAEVPPGPTRPAM